MCILLYIYGSHSLELGEDIELFYVVQDFCPVTVCKLNVVDVLIVLHFVILRIDVFGKHLASLFYKWPQ